MPATFPSPPAAVLPIKMPWPRHFDGVALVIGSMAPDLSYPLIGFHQPPDTHAPAALLWWCLPVTVLVTILLRWAAPSVAVHLGHDLGGVPTWTWLQLVSTVVGGAVALVLLGVIGRRRLIRLWHGEAPYHVRRPVRFWTPTVVLVGGYLVAEPFLPAAFAPHVQVTRVLVLVGVGQLMGAVTTRRRSGGADGSGPAGVAAGPPGTPPSRQLGSGT